MKASTRVKSVKPLPVWYRAKDRGGREGGGGEEGPPMIHTLYERLQQLHAAARGG